MFPKNRILRSLSILLLCTLTAPALADLKGTNATFYSWDDGALQYKNSNVSIVNDGKWHPFFATLEFDGNLVEPAVVSMVNGVPAVQCSTVDTDGNGKTWKTLNKPASTPWAGFLVLSLDHRDTGSATINGFQESRCWELAVCDREGNGTGDFNNGDLAVNPRNKRFAIDVTASEGSCETPNANQANGYIDPVNSNGFITLLRKDVVANCQGGRCTEKIDTELFINLDRDCDGTIDYDASQLPAFSEGNLSLIGSGGAGRIPLKTTSQSPEVCFFAQGKKPDFTVLPVWTGNNQARITGGSSSGEKTVNHSLVGSAGDVGDLPLPYPTAPHVTSFFTNNPYLGGAPDNDTQHFQTVAANGDDLSGIADEDGVVLDPSTAVDTNGIVTFGATITATNPSAVPSQVCGWFDFDKDGVLGNAPNTSTTASDPDFAARSDSGERSCLQVPSGASNGLFRMSWTIPESAQGQTGQFYFRFRISNDPDMFESALLAPGGGYDAGEVEDYRSEDVGTLPVSIAAFDSRHTAEGLEIRWMTVSETRNLGFHVWGDRGFGLEQLNDEMIPSESLDPTTPHNYRLVIPGIAEGQVKNLAVTAIDYSGDEEVYGMFEPGRNYGRKAAPAPIPWQDIKQQIDLRAQQIRAARKQQSIVASFHSGGNSRPDYVDLRVTTPGLQQVTWQMLADAGLDLSRARPEHIAVTLKGEAVSRDIVGAAPAAGKGAQSNLIGNARGTTPDNGFGADGVIRFWGETPSISDALYLDHYVYRISVDPSKALAATTQAGATTGPVDQYTAWQRVNEQVRYHFSTPGNDPWFATLLRGGRNNNHEVVFAIDDALITAGTARVMIRLGGLTAYDTTPDHHARVEVNGQIVADRFFDGNRVEQLDIEIPASLLRIGQNTVRVTAPGGANAPNDLFVVDTIDLGYPRRMVAQQDRLLIEQSNGRGQIQAEGFSNDDLLAYAVTGNGLVRLSHEAAANGWVVAATVADTDARYWLSTVSATAQPQVVATGRNSNLLAGSTADFLVIAHPAFLPTTDDEPHPLNDYLAQRRSEGWKVRTFDITEIQAVYGHGMPLPGAVTAFLGAAEQRFRYEHVLLVGGDSYDYTDRLGHGTVSFIPTRYAPTRYITHTPSDALLADLDGDGLADKAIGRWPVRSLDDLRSIVTKTLEWPNIANPHSAVWVTDSEDPNSGSFRDQAERMIASLHSEGWNEDRLDRVYFGEVGPRPGLSIAASVRMAFFDQLAEGRALTGFVGHGSPSMWSFQGLLAPDDLKDLHNEGEPTLIGTMTCYTTYFVSPSSDTVAHRWLNGYREDAAGNPIPGIPNGAVAVHGAAALSDYNQNESFASLVLSHQLKGQTLGRATLLARREAARTGLSDLVVNWTLLGDPTLILH